MLKNLGRIEFLGMVFQSVIPTLSCDVWTWTITLYLLCAIGSVYCLSWYILPILEIFSRHFFLNVCWLPFSVCSPRKNMSFSNDRTENIIRENELLRRKLYSVSTRQLIYSNRTVRCLIPSSYINRRRQQHEIFSENQVSRYLVWRCSINNMK